MELKRAHEILDSPQKITVFHHGESVWIHHVDAANRMAHVSSENNPDEVKTVPLHELEDKGPAAQ